MRSLLQYIIAIILVCLSCTACKKDTLHLQKVIKLASPTTNRINRLIYINDSISLAAGGLMFDKAEILTGTNNAYSWSVQSFPESGKGIYGATLGNNGKVYMTGFDGTVLHSADSGRSWSFNRIQDWENHVAMAYPTTSDTGIYLYSHLNDAGAVKIVDASFNVIHASRFKFGLNNIYMRTKDTGYVTGYGAIMKTTDGGYNWQFLSPKFEDFTAMSFYQNHIWVCGFNGSVFHSANGGADWQKLRNGNDIALIKYRMIDMLFTDLNNGWAVCDNGKLIHTNDGGHHWMEYDAFTTQALRCIKLLPDGTFLLAGDGGGLYRVIP